MRRVKRLRPGFLVLAVFVLVGWVLLWAYRAPERVTQEIWEDAIVRVEADTEPDWVGQHSRRRLRNARCDWWALQTVRVHDVTRDHAEVLALSYEADGWDVTRVASKSGGQFTVFAINADRSRRVNAQFGNPQGVAITAAQDPGNCPLLTFDGYTFNDKRNAIVDVFPTN